MEPAALNELHQLAIEDIVRRIKLTYDEVAALERCSKKTIQNLVAAGKYPVPVHEDQRGRRYFLAVEVLQHLFGHVQEAPKRRGRPRLPI